MEFKTLKDIATEILDDALRRNTDGVKALARARARTASAFAKLDNYDEVFAFAANEVIDFVIRSRRGALTYFGNDDVDDGVLEEARERGKKVGGAFGKDPGKVSRFVLWMRNYQLHDGTRLSEAKLMLLEEQREIHTKQRIGNERKERWFLELIRLQKKRCPSDDKPLGEVVPAKEAHDLYVEYVSEGK